MNMRQTRPTWTPVPLPVSLMSEYPVAEHLDAQDNPIIIINKDIYRYVV